MALFERPQRPVKKVIEKIMRVLRGLSDTLNEEFVSPKKGDPTYDNFEGLKRGAQERAKHLH